MKEKLLPLIAALLLPAAMSQAAITPYSNQADFLSQLNSGYYLEDFISHTSTGAMGLTEDYGPTNGFSFRASAFNATLTPSEVWAAIGALSTYSPTHTLQLTFTGLPVSAFAAQVTPTDADGVALPAATLSVVVSDGTNETTLDITGDKFVGFVSDAPLQWVQVTPYGGTGIEFSQVDNVYSGTAVPEPGAGLFVFAACGIFATRRTKRRA